MKKTVDIDDMLPFQVDFFWNDLNPGLKKVVEGHESMKHNFQHWPGFSASGDFSLAQKCPLLWCCLLVGGHYLESQVPYF